MAPTLAGFTLGAIAGQCWVPLRGFMLGAIAGRHCWVPCWGAITGVPLLGAIARKINQSVIRSLLHLSLP